MKKFYFPSLLLLVSLLTTMCSFYIDAKLQVGDIAPKFSLPDEQGRIHALSDFLSEGKKVAVAFYPKDDSPHCTKQMCSLRDGYQELGKHNIVVLGISYDTTGAHNAFKEKYHLPFLLLSDKNKKVAQLYGATGSWYTLGYIPQRITFLIDEKGLIVQIIKNVDIHNHTQQIINNFPN